MIAKKLINSGCSETVFALVVKFDIFLGETTANSETKIVKAMYATTESALQVPSPAATYSYTHVGLSVRAAS